MLPRNLPAEDMLKLFMYPEVEFVYNAFPMTQLKNPDKSYKKIDEFQKGLREYFGVIDPKAMDLSLAASEIANNQTVHRDLDNFVGLQQKPYAISLSTCIPRGQ